MSAEITLRHDFTKDIINYFAEFSKGNSFTKTTLICGDKSIQCENLLLLLSNRFWRNILNEDKNVIYTRKNIYYKVIN